MTSEDFESNRRTAEVDMSAEAVTIRLKRVSQLRRLCISLGEAQINHAPDEESTETIFGSKKQKPVS